jgi:hypothetical protein
MADFGENVPETTFAYDQFRLDPELQTGDGAEPSPVWAESQRLRKLVDRQEKRPSDGDRSFLALAVRGQVRTLDLYAEVDGLATEAVNTRNPRTVTLYVILFPGEGRDRTGIKDLNDKVLGPAHHNTFIAARKKRIAAIFSAPPGTGGARFATVGQDYKSAYILAVEKTPKDVRDALKTLDQGLREDLIAVLKEAETDSTVADKRKEQQKLRRTLEKNPKYRFDFLFGSDSLTADDLPVEVTFLLVTEALKAAGIARYAVKMNQKGALSQGRRKIPDTPKDQDDRGQPYERRLFLLLAQVADDLKKVVLAGPRQGQPIDYLDVYVNTVWTVTFLLIDLLYYANPTAIRDVRKKLLVKPPKSDGLKIGLELQIKLMELWIIAVNMIDFPSGFVSDEFPNVVDRLHRRALAAVRNLEKVDVDVAWDELTRLLTQDVRQSGQRVAFQGTPSQFQFYSAVSDFPDQIFFTMDIRDLGVELLNYYEIVTHFIVDQKLGGLDLLNHTLLSNDGTVIRKRFTYDRIVAVFHSHYVDLVGRRGGAATAANSAFGSRVFFTSGPLPSFERSVQVMIGGDEFFVGAHPLYAERVSQIIADLDKPFFDPTLGDVDLNMRAAVAFSSAKQISRAGSGSTTNGPGISDAQRQENFKAHDRAMKLSAEAPNVLKDFERAQDAIDRLIRKLETNPKNKNKDKAPAFRTKLDQLGLLRLYARAKFMHASASSPAAYARLHQALAAGDLAGASKTGEFDLVDFNGDEVKGPDLLQQANDLHTVVRRAVGTDNVHFDPPPALFLAAQADSARGKVEKVIKAIKGEQLPPKKP